MTADRLGQWHDGRVRVVVHVGLTKTGTTHLQALLAAHREPLLAAGWLYPDLGPGTHFRAAADVRRSAHLLGLDTSRVDGAWSALCAEARRHVGETGGDVVLGHEVLAGATTEQAVAALAHLDGLDVHVVVTARDLGRQAVAHWQERVKLGDTRSFATFEAEELRADTGRDDGPDAGGVRPRFWHGQDLADTLARWTAGGATGHLVVGPAPGAPREELWRRFAEALGVPTGPDGPVDPALPVAGNPSLGAPEVALVREVNRLLAADEPPMSTEVHHRVVKRGWAEQELAARSSTPARTPASLGPLLTAATHVWLGEVTSARHLVHGDPTDLDPVLARPGDPPPDVPWPADVDPAAVADMLRARAVGPAARRSRRPWRRSRPH
ncbi:MAG: hypothetical protein ACO1ON_00215 [Nocardioides sp.]